MPNFKGWFSVSLVLSYFVVMLGVRLAFDGFRNLPVHLFEAAFFGLGMGSRPVQVAIARLNARALARKGRKTSEEDETRPGSSYSDFGSK